ncbi:MAG: hypothetical protein JWQ46_469, partial [Phenylobacterium sp.]|nr:hypothetical protein [Phenylobacterium sp.]
DAAGVAGQEVTGGEGLHARSFYQAAAWAFIQFSSQWML